MMNHLPLRSRDEAEKIGNKLLSEEYIKHVVDENKSFQDAYLFYRFCKKAAQRVAAVKAVHGSLSLSLSLSLFSCSHSSFFLPSLFSLLRFLLHFFLTSVFLRWEVLGKDVCMLMNERDSKNHPTYLRNYKQV